MKTIILLSGLCLLGACGEKQFNKSVKSASDRLEAGQDAIQESSPNTIPTEDSNLDPSQVSESELPVSGEMPLPGATPAAPSIPLKSDERTALDQCLKQWTTPPPPFTAAQIANPQVVNITEDKSNNQYVYEDLAQSAQPKLFLINLTVDIANQGTMALRNAKGWYCINVSAKVINNFTINLAQDTQVTIVSKFAQNDNKFSLVRD